MQRREFFAVAALMMAAARSIKQAIRVKDPKYSKDVSGLRTLADGVLEKGPWNITFSHPQGIEVPAHEYAAKDHTGGRTPKIRMARISGRTAREIPAASMVIIAK